MRLGKIEVTLSFFALSLTPLAIWAALGVARRVYQPNLRPWLPRMRVLRWIFYIIGVAVLFATVVSDTHWLFSIGMGLSCLSMGLALPEGWLKRHYAPELLHSERESPDGWWPTPRG